MKDMKKLLLLTAIAVMAHTVRAQILSPVKWSCAAKRTGQNEAMLLFKASIDDGWHIYSVHQAPGGPVKTAFKFTPGAGYTLIGKVSEPAPLTKFEDAFGIDVKYFEKEVVFRQTVRLKTGK